MKRIACSAALLVMVAGGAASAADLPHPSYYTATAPLSAYSWTGPYLGGNLGYEWGATSNNPTRPSGFAGGAEAGYNWQTGQLVFGGEADIQLSGASDTFAPWKFSNPWFGTMRGRAGYAVSNFLIYGTAGVAFGELQGETFGLADREPYQCGLDRRRRRRGRLRAELVGEGRISVRRSRQQQLCADRHEQRALGKPDPHGRELSFLEHFQEKWNPVFRLKMRQRKNAGAVSVPVYVKPL